MIRSNLVKRLAPSVRIALLAATAAVPAFAGVAQAAPGGHPHMMPMHYADATGATGTTAPSFTPDQLTAAETLVYGGGPVISNVQVVAVYWGSGVGSAIQSWAPAYFAAVNNSAYLDALSEYDTPTSGGTGQKIGRGTFLVGKTITPTMATGNAVDDSAIGPELDGQIAAGKLPAPTYDAQGFSNTIYMIFFSPGISITNGAAHASCVQFCGYHMSYPLSSNGKPFPYAVIPDMSAGSGCDAGCGAGSGTTLISGTVSHELAEAITDMDVGAGNNGAWYNQQYGEIGDICAYPSSPAAKSPDTALVAGYTVQLEWSNKNNKCEATDPSIMPPGCTTNSQCTGNTPVCTAGTCVACGSDADCPGAHCATGAGDSHKGACVACTASSQCSNPKPVCGTADTCGACASNPDCAGNAAGAVCDTTGGSCVQCAASSDCSDPNNPVCSTTTHTCGPQAGVDAGMTGGGNDAGGGLTRPDAGSTGGHHDAGTSNGTDVDAGDGTSGDTGGTTTSSGCAVSTTGSSTSTGLGGAFGALLALALALRKRTKK